MRKFIIPLLVVAVLLVSMPLAANISAESVSEAGSEESIPADTLITYAYLEKFKEELREEIIAELIASGGITITSTYNDFSAKEGQILLLSADCEVIYRGGGAVAITSSCKQDDGITDMSEGKELFSGEPLEYGHIYFASATESKKAILVTGATAYFTIRGSYEVL